MNKKQKRNLIRILIAAALMIALKLAPIPEAILGWCYLAPYFVIGYDILIKAFKGVKNRQPFDENFLMTVATIGAMAVGDFPEGTMVMLFYQIGELFQSYAVGKSRRNIGKLMDIRPDSANLEQPDGSTQRVDPDEVAVGSVIVVRPGEKIPLDGEILDGDSALDTRALTGESVPRTVHSGDSVFSGCVNQTGLLRIRTTRPFGESTASRILNLVENASSCKSRSEQFISRFARVYTPAVCGAALALAVLPPLVLLMMHQPAAWSTWIYRALTFLVISCPCALVISIPLSFFAGIGGASSAGVLVKGSNYLEMLAKVDCMVFDKTGTMTEGVFDVNEVVPADGVSADDLLTAAALAESISTHPISQSLLRAYGKPVEASRIANAQEVSGHGVSAEIDGRRVAVGNPKWMAQQQVTVPAVTAGGTVVYVAIDGAYAGYIRISDRIKPHSAAAIAQLKREGIRRTVMLTGDRQAAAEPIAAQLGVDEVHSELLPADKVSIVEKLLGEGCKVAFIGDGINDAPVLARADVGIAMGAMGSDAAIEAADVVLMDDDPLKTAVAIRAARKCIRIVYENIVFALGVKAICLILGAIGVANMGAAIFADVGVMIIAVLNAIRALRVPQKL